MRQPLTDSRYRPAEDLTGRHVLWSHGAERQVLEVVGQGYRTFPGAAGAKLDTRYFNGEPGPTIPYHAVQVLEDH